MAKLTLRNVQSGYNRSNINQNFEDIEDYINDKVLSREDDDEPNQMEDDLDLNSNDIHNVDSLQTREIILNGERVVADSFITAPTADEVVYDNATSGLVADNVQAAIDEIAVDLGDLSTNSVSTVTGTQQLSAALNNRLPYFSTLTDLQAAVNGGAVSVGAVAATLSYYAGWATTATEVPYGGNTYELVDAGSAGARPADDGGSIVHCTGGSGGLYLKGLFPDNKYNVKQWGARGDGVTAADDDKINAAVRYLVGIGGGTLFYPQGTYLIDRGIRLDAYNTVDFTYGATRVQNVNHIGEDKEKTILLMNSFWACGFTSFPEPFIPQPAFGGELDFLGESVTIQNMTIDGNYTALGDGGVLYGSPYSGMPAWPDGSTADAIHQADNYQYPIYAFRFNDLKVRDVKVKRSWYNGIEIYRTFNYEIGHCAMENCGDKANYLGYYSGVQLDNGSSVGDIHNSTFTDCGHNILSNGGPIDTNDRAVERVRIYNNRFDAPTQNHHISGFDWIEKWDIFSNEFYDSPREVVRFTFDNPGGSTKLERHTSDITIRDNKVYEFNLINSSGRPAFRINGHNIKITNNEVYQTAVSVTNNTYGVLLSEVGITIPSGSYQYAEVSGNRFIGEYAGSASTVSMCNISIDNARVYDNEFETTGTSCQLAARLDGDSCYFGNNNIKGAFQNVSGARPFIYVSGSEVDIDDTKYASGLRTRTTSGEAGKTGTNTVDFNNFGIVDRDVRSNFSGALNSFSADIPGIYRVKALAAFNGVGTPAAPVSVNAFLELNTTTPFGASAGLSPGRLDLTCEDDIPMSPGNTIRLRMNCASSHTIESGCSLIIEYIRPLE